MSTPRLRMFAGPNGSGKSTIKKKVESANPKWLGVYVNPDDIESELRSDRGLNFNEFGLSLSRSRLTDSLSAAPQIVDNDLLSSVSAIDYRDDRIHIPRRFLNSYVVSAIADLLHAELVSRKVSFSFETVMSHTAKLDLLTRSRKNLFRNYLYFVATEDPEINISRVAIRVGEGGHNVPDDKVRSRYYKTLQNLTAAIGLTDRAYIYDNSGAEATLIAEITKGTDIEIRNSNIPHWFEKYVLAAAK